jgi:hypothetical protein
MAAPATPTSTVASVEGGHSFKGGGCLNEIVSVIPLKETVKLGQPPQLIGVN